MIRIATLWLALLCAGVTPPSLLAADTTAQQAVDIVKQMLIDDPTPFGCQIGKQVAGMDTITDAQGAPLFHCVTLQPNGFVLVAPDDRLDPIMAVCPQGPFQKDPEHGLYALASRDISVRKRALRDGAITAQEQGRALQHWNAVVGGIHPKGASPKGLTSISNVFRSSLVQSKWGQSVDGWGTATWNLLTPNNYLCGCVATSMAQVIYTRQWPTSGVGTGTRPITVNKVPRSVSLQGGDGLGGPYDYGLMVDEPGIFTSSSSRLMMSRLCADVGAAVNMGYGVEGSGAMQWNAAQALKGTFGYADAHFVFGSTFLGPNPLPQEVLDSAIKSNLDANLPVLLSIHAVKPEGGPDGNHSILCDGYGYDAANAAWFYHLNFGWRGGSDGWYRLPAIGSEPGYDYSFLDVVVFNIFSTQSGVELLTGTVVNDLNQRVPGATVTVTVASTSVPTTTDAAGIWGFYVPSNVSATVTASYGGFSYPTIPLTMGQTADGALTGQIVVGATYSNPGSVGNKQGITLRPVLPSPPSISGPLVTTAMLGRPFTYSIAATNQPTSYSATGLPAGLTINTVSGVIAGTPTAAGTVSIGISATNEIGTDNETLSLTIGYPPAPIITSAATATCKIGEPLYYTITASNLPRSFSASGLPPGFSVDATSGRVVGVPASAGTATITVRATNEGGTGSKTVSLQVTAPPVGLTWEYFGDLTESRDSASWAWAGDTVLVTGGFDSAGSVLATCEALDPATGLWSATASMATARAQHELVTLQDGSLLAIGGWDGSAPLASCERFDPATGTWAPTGSLASPRNYFTATVLGDGRVLVAGGSDGNATLAACEVFDPGSNTWSPTTPMTTGRAYHAGTLLASGLYLICGGYNGQELASAEVFNPSGNTWTATGAMTVARDSHSIVRMASGNVLVAGGTDLLGYTLRSAEVFDAASGTWARVGDMFEDRCHGGLVPVGDDYMAVGGLQIASDGLGDFSYGALRACERFNEATGTWTSTLLMNDFRSFQTVIPWSPYQVLAIGGFDASGALVSCEAYTSVTVYAPRVTVATPNTDTTPTWRWSSGGGGTGTYRWKLDDADLSSGALQGTARSFTATGALALGQHTLYVQEQDAGGSWSGTGSARVTLVPPAPPLLFLPSGDDGGCGLGLTVVLLPIGSLWLLRRRRHLAR